jgi:uncharacterized protein
VTGSGSTKVSMLSTVVALANGGSEVSVNADVELVGKIVQFGRGMIEEVSRQMFKQFAACVRQHLEVPEPDDPSAEKAVPPVPPIPAIPPNTKAVAAAPIAFRALWAIIGRFFKGLFGSKAESR